MQITANILQDVFYNTKRYNSLTKEWKKDRKNTEMYNTKAYFWGLMKKAGRKLILKYTFGQLQGKW